MHMISTRKITAFRSNISETVLRTEINQLFRL